MNLMLVLSLAAYCYGAIGPRSNGMPSIPNPGDIRIYKYLGEVSNLYKIYWSTSRSEKFKTTIQGILSDIKLDELSGAAFYHNKRMDFYMNSLFSLDPVSSKEVEKYMDCPLTDLILEHKKLDSKLTFITATSFKKNSHFLSQEMFMTDALTFLLHNRDIFEETHETRAAMMHLFLDNSQPYSRISQLVDSEDIQLFIVFKNGFDAAGLIYFGGIAQSRMDCMIAVLILENVIMKIDTEQMINYVGILKRTGFLVHLLQKLGERNIKISEFIPFLLPREDSNDIYGQLYDTGSIRESILKKTDKYDPRTKIECGLMLNLEDGLLLPIIESCENSTSLKTLLWIAIYRNRSLEIIQGLIEKLPTEFVFEQEASEGPVAKLLQGCFNASSEKVLCLVKMKIGHILGWYNRLELSSRTTFLRFSLDNPDSGMDDLIGILHCCRLNEYQESDQDIMGKIVRFTMTTKGKSFFISDELVETLENQVRIEIRVALDEGVDPRPMFQRRDGEPIDLDKFGMVVLEETSKSGTNLMNNPDVMNKNSIHSLIKSAIQYNVGLEIGSLEHSAEFKDMIGSSLISLFSGVSGFPVNYSTLHPKVRPRLFKTILGKSYQNRTMASDTIKTVFHHLGAEEIRKALPWMSSFHRAVYQVLESDGLIELLNI